jgi:hypothetical protein
MHYFHLVMIAWFALATIVTAVAVKKAEPIKAAQMSQVHHRNWSIGVIILTIVLAWLGWYDAAGLYVLLSAMIEVSYRRHTALSGGGLIEV